MVSTNRIKNIDGDEYEDDFADDVADDFADEEQEGELTEEDVEKMNEGTRAVREALGDYSVNVSTKDIQDDLWHYWYDVDKVVLHILNVKAKNEAKQAKQAQHSAQSTKAKAGGKAASEPVKVNIDLANDMEKATIIDSLKVKSRNLDVVAEYEKAKRKKSLNFVVIGHVDAGKSTLMGRLLLDLGIYDQRTLAKHQKDADSIGKGSFALAWMMDQGAEERERGVTIDIAQNKFETAQTQFMILDAPGHRDFIPNMIAGAAQADFAVLVLDAGTGAFESGMRGQTKEHAQLARSIGVTRLVIAVNKLDKQAWSKERFDQISTEMTAFLTPVGFVSKRVTFVPCSGLTGDNITSRTKSPDASWYTGPILLEALEQVEAPTRSIEGPLRLQISDVFRGGVQNPLSVSGRIDLGSVQVGDNLLVVPGNHVAGVKAIEVNQEPSDYAVAGQNVVLHLAELDAPYIRAGDVLCAKDKPLESIKEFSVKVLTFTMITPQTLDIHRGRLHVPARVTQLNALLERSTGKVIKKKPRVVKSGEVAMMQIAVESEHGIPLEKGMRVILRASGETLASGLVQ